MADPVRRGPWPARIGTACGDGLLALVLNLAVMGWLAGLGWPKTPTEAPAPVSVDLVDHVPGEEGRKHIGFSKDAAAPRTGPAAPAERTAAADPAKPSTPERASESPPASDNKPPPAGAPAHDVPPPKVKSADPGAAPAPAAALPPPPEHPDNDAKPHLVEAPLPPPPVQTQPDAPAKPVEAHPDAHVEPVAGPPPPQPKVLSADRSDEMVPDMGPPPPSPPAPTEEEKRQAANTATLAAMLPFGTSVASDPFRSAVSAQGQARDAAYRGAVYANFNKAADVIEAARAQHLKGQAVVAFTVDDAGGLAQLAVAVSSGNPAIDQAAIELIRRAAPFPPPPPGAQRSFSPAIGLGLDE